MVIKLCYMFILSMHGKVRLCGDKTVCMHEDLLINKIAGLMY